MTSPLATLFAQKFIAPELWVPFFNLVAFVLGVRFLFSLARAFTSSSLHRPTSTPKSRSSAPQRKRRNAKLVANKLFPVPFLSLTCYQYMLQILLPVPRYKIYPKQTVSPYITVQQLRCSLLSLEVPVKIEHDEPKGPRRCHLLLSRVASH